MYYGQQAPAGAVLQMQAAPVVQAVPVMQAAPVMQALPVMQAAPAIISQAQPVAIDSFNPSSAAQMRKLSQLQVSMGSLCLTLGITLMGLYYGGYKQGIGSYGYGIWIGVFFILSGSIGIGAVKNNSASWITAALMLNIICSAIWSGTMITFSSIGLTITSINGCTGSSSSYRTYRASRSSSYRSYRSYSYSRYNYYNYYDYYDYEPSSYYSGSSGCTIRNVYYGLDSLMLIMGIVEFIITIWCAALCCGAICRCCRRRQTQVVSFTVAPAPMAMTTQPAVYPSVPTPMYNAQPAMQQPMYQVGVHQPGPPAGYMAQPGPPAGYMAQPGPSQGYTTLPVQPPSFNESEYSKQQGQEMTSQLDRPTG